MKLSSCSDSAKDPNEHGFLSYLHIMRVLNDLNSLVWAIAVPDRRHEY
jgi:hypothetical protein